MLALVFFLLIFSSFLWLFFSVSFVIDSLEGMSFFDAGIANIMLYTLLICLPIFLLWSVFGYINQYLQNQAVGKQLQKLWGQLKKNQDYSDLVARALIEAKQNVNDGFMLVRLDLLISELNELLSEIIRGCKFASVEQIDVLWAKVQNGGKWSFGKVLIEVNNSQPDFERRVLEYCAYNSILGGTIMEFCARYDSILKLLEVHDKDKIFLEILETGVMGKVRSILFPVAAKLNTFRNAVDDYSQEVLKPVISSEIKPFHHNYISDKEDVNDSQTSSFSLLNKFNLFKKKTEKNESEIVRDPFSIALERSFGDEYNEETAQEPKIIFGTEDDSIHQISEPEETDTQKTLENLKKEWSDNLQMKKEDVSKVIQEETDMIYPFGSWADEQSYRK